MARDVVDATHGLHAAGQGDASPIEVVAHLITADLNPRPKAPAFRTNLGRAVFALILGAP